MIQKALGDDAMSAAQIKVWYKYFKDVENLLKEPHPARPATSRPPESVEHVTIRALVNKDWQPTVGELEKLIWGFRKLLCLEILT